MPEAARVRLASPPAGTALAPMRRCASGTGPSPSENHEAICTVNGDNCQPNSDGSAGVRLKAGVSDLALRLAANGEIGPLGRRQTAVLSRVKPTHDFEAASSGRQVDFTRSGEPSQRNNGSDDCGNNQKLPDNANHAGRLDYSIATAVAPVRPRDGREADRRHDECHCDDRCVSKNPGPARLCLAWSCLVLLCLAHRWTLLPATTFRKNRCAGKRLPARARGRSARAAPYLMPGRRVKKGNKIGSESGLFQRSIGQAPYVRRPVEDGEAVAGARQSIETGEPFGGRGTCGTGEPFLKLLR
jgi:hypothetical protein